MRLSLLKKISVILVILPLLLPASIFIAPNFVEVVSANDPPVNPCGTGGCCPGGGSSCTIPDLAPEIPDPFDIPIGDTGLPTGVPGFGGTQAAADVPGTGPYGKPTYETRIPLPVASRAQNATSKSTAAATKQQKFEWARTFILEALKKRVLDMMVGEIVRWIAGGEEPQFVTNWQEFLGEAANIAGGDFATAMGLEGLCEPIRADLRLGSGWGGLSDSGINDPYACTLDKIVSNIESFYDDFKNGGWVAYQKSWEPNNNYLALFIKTTSDRTALIEARQEAAKLEALAGGGYLSTLDCIELGGSTGPDLDRDGRLGDVSSTCTVTTPGSTLGTLVGRAVAADIDFIVNSTQLATYVAAITDALFYRIIREGSAGLRGVDNDPYVAIPSDECPSGGLTCIPDAGRSCAALINNPTLYQSCLDYQTSNAFNFDETRDDLSDEILSVAVSIQNHINALTGLKTQLETILAFIEQERLRHTPTCIPAALTAYQTSEAEILSLKNDVMTRLTNAQANLVIVNEYKARLDAIAPDDWATLSTLSSEISSQLSTLTVSETLIDALIAQKATMAEAFDGPTNADSIKARVLRCF